MKGTADEPQYAVGLLEGGVTLCDVIDNHIYEQTLVGVVHRADMLSFTLIFWSITLSLILVGRLFSFFSV